MFTQYKIYNHKRFLEEYRHVIHNKKICQYKKEYNKEVIKKYIEKIFLQF